MSARKTHHGLKNSASKPSGICFGIFRQDTMISAKKSLLAISAVRAKLSASSERYRKLKIPSLGVNGFRLLPTPLSKIIPAGSHAVWFRQPYLERTLTPGTIVSLSGKVARDKKGIYLSNPVYERISSGELESENPEQTNLTHTGRLVPVYPETAGVTSKYLRFLIKKILDAKIDFPDPLPTELLKKYNLPNILTPFNVHFPKKSTDSQKAKERFAFEDILLFQLRALRARRRNAKFKIVDNCVRQRSHRKICKESSV